MQEFPYPECGRKHMHTRWLHRLMARCLLLAAALWLSAGMAFAADSAETARLLPIDDNRYMVDVNLHTPEELMDLLTRVETIANARGPSGKNTRPPIVLMLHGREVEFFAISNYAKYKPIVDLAARLDAFKAVEVRMCQSAMSDFDVKDDEIPAFIDLVPYGPDELKRLEGQGYNYLM